VVEAVVVAEAVAEAVAVACFKEMLKQTALSRTNVTYMAVVVVAAVVEAGAAVVVVEAGADVVADAAALRNVLAMWPHAFRRRTRNAVAFTRL
jgi:hypothetical protein